MIHAQRKIGDKVFVRRDRLKPVLHALTRIASDPDFVSLSEDHARQRV